MLSPSHLLDFSSLPLRVFPLIEIYKKKQVKSFKIFQVITAQKKKKGESGIDHDQIVTYLIKMQIKNLETVA